VTERPSPAAAATAVPARWRLLTILTTSYGAGAFGMLGLSPLSPSLVDGFGLTRFQVAFIVPSIYLAGLLFSLPGGRIADRLGVRPALLGGLAVGATGLFAAALAPSFLAFLFCLFTAGAGLGPGPARRRGRARLAPRHRRVRGDRRASGGARLAAARRVPRRSARARGVRPLPRA
jgi:MFS family permease